MSRTEVRPIARTATLVLAALAITAFLTWWTITHHGDQNTEVHQPGTGAMLATPALVWPDGLPQGEHESSPWAQTVRDWNLAYAVAFNARDFSDATFATLTTDDLRQTNAEYVLDLVDTGQFPIRYRFGPTPLTITDIAVDNDTTHATVTTCEIDLAWSALDLETANHEIETAASFPYGVVVEYQVEATPGGSLVVTARDRRHQRFERCTLDNARRALFDPAPPYGMITQPEDVIGADGQPLVEPTADPSSPGVPSTLPTAAAPENTAPTTDHTCACCSRGTRS